MKISDEEVQAAIAAWNSPAENVEDSIRAALSAAYTVRKARKAAKRAKAKPSLLDNELAPEPAAPAWNGKFEVGKAYRTRDGRKVIISDVINSLPYPLRGELSGYFDSWTVTGCNVADKQNSGDLVGQWED